MSLKLHDTFFSYEEFEGKLEEYCAKHNDVVFVVFSSKKVGLVNSRLADWEKHKAWDEALKYKTVTLQCKQGKSRKSESTGARPNQRSLKLNCPVFITLTAERGLPQRLRIDGLNLNHNHETNKGYNALLPENRRPDEVELQKIEEQIDIRGQPLAIREQFRKDTGKAMTARDFANIKQKKKKKSLEGRSETEDVLNELKSIVNTEGAEFIIGYRNEDSTIFERNHAHADDCQKEIAYIYIQTAKMKEDLKKYPEVIGMDTTYQLNKNNMHLVVMKCIDNNKIGRTVAYCLIARETSDVLQSTLTHFKALNPEAAQNMKTVLVDKDYKEIAGIRTVLPHVNVHLCHVHVMRTFKTSLNEKKVKSKTESLNILKKMSVSGSKAEFDEQYENLKKISNEAFVTYFDKNWKDIDECWILYVRNESLSLGVTDTNHVESHNGKIKLLVSKCGTVGELIRSLMLLERNSNFESMYKDFREKATRAYITNIPDEPEVDEIMAKFALWPATLLVEEWKESNNDTEEEALVVEGTCCCPFNSKFGLQHCRHIFRSRRMAGLSLLDMALVPVRWRKPTFIPEEPLSTPQSQAGQASGAGFMVEVESEVTAPKTHNERYLHAKEICLRISSLLANTGGAQYISGIKAIKKLEAILRRGDEAIVTVAGETTCDNNDNNTQEENIISRDDPPYFGDDKCHKCKGQMERHITERDTKGNKGRYHLRCPKNCRNSFRWYQCPNCASHNVRVGHNCTKNITPPVNQSTPDQSPHLHDDESTSPTHNQTQDTINDSTSTHSSCPSQTGANTPLMNKSQDLEDRSHSTTPNHHQDMLSNLSDDSTSAHSSCPSQTGANTPLMDKSQDLEDRSHSTTPNHHQDMLSNLSDDSTSAVNTFPSETAHSSSPSGTDDHTPQMNQSLGLPGDDFIINNGYINQAESRISPLLNSESETPSRALNYSPDLFADEEDNMYERGTYSPALNPNQEIRHIFGELDENINFDIGIDELMGMIGVEENDHQDEILAQPTDINRYERSMAIPDSHVTELKKGKWSVRSQTVSGKKYNVTQKCANKCGLAKCTDITPCKHLYLCDCPDYTNPCKHIFKVHFMRHTAPTVRKPEKTNTPSQGRGILKHTADDSKLQFILPPAQRVQGRPSSFKTRTVNKKSKEVVLDSTSQSQRSSSPVFGQRTCPRPVRNHLIRTKKTPTSENLSKTAKPQVNTPSPSANNAAIEASKAVCEPTPEQSENLSKTAKPQVNTPSPSANNAVIEASKAVCEPTPEQSAGENKAGENAELHSSDKIEVTEISLTDDADTKSILDFLPDGDCRIKFQEESISKESIKNCILPKAAITDDIINAFLKILKLQKELKYVTVTLVKCFETEAMVDFGYSPTHVSGEFLCCDIIMVPAHVDQGHYVLFLALPGKKVILILDSMSSSPNRTGVRKHLKALMYLINRRHEELLGRPIVWSQWTVHAPHDIAKQQVSSNDCALHMCLWAYAIVKQTTFESKLKQHQSVRLRKSLCKCVLDNCFIEKIVQPKKAPPLPKQASTSEDFINKWYAELETNNAPTDRPWDNILVPPFLTTCPQGKDTFAYLTAILSNLWKATEKYCAVGSVCRSTVGQYQCELCRDWFHQKCVNDVTVAPAEGQPYFCPSHRTSVRPQGRRAVHAPSRLTMS